MAYTSFLDPVDAEQCKTVFLRELQSRWPRSKLEKTSIYGTEMQVPSGKALFLFAIMGVVNTNDECQVSDLMRGPKNLQEYSPSKIILIIMTIGIVVISGSFVYWRFDAEPEASLENILIRSSWLVLSVAGVMAAFGVWFFPLLYPKRCGTHYLKINWSKDQEEWGDPCLMKQFQQMKKSLLVSAILFAIAWLMLAILYLISLFLPSGVRANNMSVRRGVKLTLWIMLFVSLCLSTHYAILLRQVQTLLRAPYSFIRSGFARKFKQDLWMTAQGVVMAEYLIRLNRGKQQQLKKAVEEVGGEKYIQSILPTMGQHATHSEVNDDFFLQAFLQTLYRHFNIYHSRQLKLVDSHSDHDKTKTIQFYKILKTSR